MSEGRLEKPQAVLPPLRHQRGARQEIRSIRYEEDQEWRDNHGGAAYSVAEGWIERE